MEGTLFINNFEAEKEKGENCEMRGQARLRQIASPCSKRSNMLITKLPQQQQLHQQQPHIQLLRSRMNSDLLIRVFIMVLVISLQVAETIAVRGSKKGHPPRFGHSQLMNHTVRVGNEVHFSCTVGHLGDYKVAWLHSVKGTLAVHPDVITQNHRISVSYDNRETYHLKLHNVQESDAGMYICQINTGPVISISGTLSVVVPPDILDDESSSDTLATEGMRVLLNCRARGNPVPTISWVREDGKLLRICKSESGGGNSNKQKKKSRTGMECSEVKSHYGADLELNQVSRFDSGTYLCLANNGVPPTVSKRVQLYVDFAPTIWISHQLIGAMIGSSIELECLTAAHPPSLNYWSRDGESYIVPREDKYHLTQTEGDPSHYNIQMKLKILNVTALDFGTYKCMAKNSQGDSNSDITLYEIPRPSTTTSAYDFVDYEWPKRELLPTTRLQNQSTSVILLHNDEEAENNGDGDKHGGNGGRENQKHRKRKKDRKNHRNKNRDYGGRRDGGEDEEEEEENPSPDQRYHMLNSSPPGIRGSPQSCQFIFLLHVSMVVLLISAERLLLPSEGLSNTHPLLNP